MEDRETVTVRLELVPEGEAPLPVFPRGLGIRVWAVRTAEGPPAGYIGLLRVRAGVLRGYWSNNRSGGTYEAPETEEAMRRIGIDRIVGKHRWRLAGAR